MKYAILFGSNAFFVDRPVITYVQDDTTIELIKIKSLFAPVPQSTDHQQLVVDSNLTDMHGHNITLADNDYDHPDYKVHRSDKQIHVTNSDGHIILDVLQLDEAALSGLSSHVVNELHSIGADHVLRIRGDFMIGEHHITIDNEKLFIDDDVYAESVQVGHNGIQLSKNGVLV